jgi:methylmalonyl-CoA mutase
MASAPTTPLADGFPPADREAWLASVQRSLRGAPFDTLVSRTADGLEIQPLYVSGDAEGRLTCRGGGPPRSSWDVRTVVSHPDPGRANAQILEDLAGGASSVLLTVGDQGCAAGSEDDMARALSGVVLEAAAVALDAGFLGPQAARWLAACARSSPQARLALHLDPLTAFAERGASPGPIEAHVRAAAQVAAPLAETYAGASFFLATGRAAHEAGGTEAQELGVMAAAAVAYARALGEQGMNPAEALGRIVFGLSVDGDYFTSIAKLRAGRRIAERLGEATGRGEPPVVEARASGRMLTRLDAWTNLLRLTAAGFAGGAGGADAVVLSPFTDAIGAPSPLARRQARNTQLELMEESHLGRVADPAAGSWFIESVTAELAREGWAVFQAIEREGGLVAALTSGFIAANVEGARAALHAAAERRGVLGVTRFPDPEERPVATDATAAARPGAGPDPRLPGEDSTCRPLSPMRITEPYEVFDGALS